MAAAIDTISMVDLGNQRNLPRVVLNVANPKST